MATVVQSSAGAVLSGAGPQTRALTGVAAGNSLIMLVSGGDSGGLAAPAFACSDGSAYSDGMYNRLAGNYQCAGCLYRHNVSAGDYTASLSWAGGVGTIRGACMLIEVSGLFNAAPDSQRGNNFGEPFDGSTPAITSGTTGTLTNVNNFMLGVAFTSDGPAGAGWALPSGYTSLYSNTSANGNERFCYQNAAVTTAQNLDFGTSANNYWWAATCMAFRLAASSGARYYYEHGSNDV